MCLQSRRLPHTGGNRHFAQIIAAVARRLHPPSTCWPGPETTAQQGEPAPAPAVEPASKKPPRAFDWVRAEVAAGRVPGTAGYPYKTAVRRATKDLPGVRGLSERNLKRLFGMALNSK